MAFDGLFMRALREELSSHIADGIIDRIYQPARDTVVLSIYTRQGVKRLLISVRAQAPRVQPNIGILSYPP
ncbi:MAG: NFACT family protein [Clostridia bacterium]|nr:NFACT family protein [Clostridia bacterium]